MKQKGLFDHFLVEETGTSHKALRRHTENKRKEGVLHKVALLLQQALPEDAVDD